MTDPRYPRPALGIALAVAATACFALLDTTSPFVGGVVPVLMAVWLRFLVQTVMTAAMLAPSQGRRLFTSAAPGWQLLRVALKDGGLWGPGGQGAAGLAETPASARLRAAC